jgi:hypothetical protein
MPESAPQTRGAWVVRSALLVVMVTVVAVILLAQSSSPIAQARQAAPTPTPRSVVIGGDSPTPTPRTITAPRPTATSTTPRPTSTPFPLGTRPPIPTAAPISTATPPPAPTATAPPPVATLPPPTIAPAAGAPTVAPAAASRIDFAAADWSGGFYRGDSQFYGRPWVAVYGALSDFPQATLAFTLDQTPGGAATLTITGLDDEWADLNPMRVAVNGQEIYQGASPFLNWDGRGTGADAAWTSVPFTIPAGVLRAGRNEITVANLTPVASFNAPPYILLSTATLEIGSVASEQPAAGVDFAAADWVGGFYRGDSQFYGRPWTAVYGAQSEYPRATLRFRLDGQPASPAVLIVTGLDDELAELNPIAIEVNGQEAYSGPSPFDNWDGRGNGADAAWRQIEITIPPDLLRSGRNEVAIANLSPAANVDGPPYVLLAEASLDVPGVGITPLAGGGGRR